MHNKDINKLIRQISNYSSLPLLFYLIMFEISGCFLQFLFYLFEENSVMADAGLQSLITYIVIYLMIFPVSMFLFYKLKGRKNNFRLNSCLKKPKRSVGWITKWIILSLGLTYLFSALSSLLMLFLECFGININNIAIDFGDSIYSILVTVLVMPVLAPIFEELLFRGTIYRNTEPMGQWFAIILNAVMFGLWHANGAQYMYTFVLGVMSSFLIAKTRSVFPSVILHFLFNIIGTIQSLCLMNLDIEKLGEENIDYIMSNIIPIMMYSIMVLLIIGLIIAGIVLLIIELVKHRGKFTLNSGEYRIKTLNKIAIYFSAPITIVVFVILIAETIINAIFV